MLDALHPFICASVRIDRASVRDRAPRSREVLLCGWSCSGPSSSALLAHAGYVYTPFDGQRLASGSALGLVAAVAVIALELQAPRRPRPSPGGRARRRRHRAARRRASCGAPWRPRHRRPSTSSTSLLVVFLGYMGIVIGARKGEWFEPARIIAAFKDSSRLHQYKILDTSVIIDGRIADICETGFLEGTLVVPQFVLRELQQVADSSDSLKRNRGRRGLDILQKIQKMSNVHVQIVETDFPEVREVDLKLIELARRMSGKIVTNDFNLNKVAQLRGVRRAQHQRARELAEAGRAAGRGDAVFVIKEGKEAGQGVGYLDDGTMVVVDQGKRALGQTIEVTRHERAADHRRQDDLLPLARGRAAVEDSPPATPRASDPARGRDGARRRPAASTEPAREGERTDRVRRPRRCRSPEAAPAQAAERAVVKLPRQGRVALQGREACDVEAAASACRLALLAAFLRHPFAPAVRAREPAPDPCARAIERHRRPARVLAPRSGGSRSAASDRPVLYARNADKNLTPASTLKLLTTAAAARRLRRRTRGPHHASRPPAAWSTRGGLLGDVYLVGRGDPNLSGRFPEGRAIGRLRGAGGRAGRSAGVRRIEGRLIGHEGLFTGERRGDDWTWDDLVWWYGAEVSALSFNDNSADLTASPGERVGDAARDRAQPRRRPTTRSCPPRPRPAADAQSELKLVRELGGERHPALGHHPARREAVGGTWRSRIRPAMPRPCSARCSRLRASASTGEVGDILGAAAGRAPGPGPHDSAADLRVILKPINKQSQNLHAEMLLRLLGARVSGRGQRRGGARGHRGVPSPDRRARRTPGALQDASGLSRSDLLSAARDRQPARGDGRASARPGVQGQPADRRRGRDAQEPHEGHARPRAGSWPRRGSIRHENALAGYATTRAGEPPGVLDRRQPPRRPARERPRLRSTRSASVLVDAMTLASARRSIERACAAGLRLGRRAARRRRRCARQDPALAAEIEAYGAGAPRALRGRAQRRRARRPDDARALYKALGLDPTKTRPSNEALLAPRAARARRSTRQHAGRRAQPGARCATQLPFGLYDLGPAAAAVVLRAGRPARATRGSARAP